PVTAAPAVPATHPYAYDLGVVGQRASILQLLGPLGTATGARTAARWLLAPAPIESIRARQQAVAELAGHTAGAPVNAGDGTAEHDDFRLELAARARLASSARMGDVRLFLEWAAAEPWLALRPALGATRWLLP